ncbi:Catalase [Operophtera brumata]|uniref:Catalase n=1 Tax=Operophtera brumata TaxID=104452 RepID=A0A0L7L9M6_OPEBR|nr:Catalase [Operophtera brumata]
MKDVPNYYPNSFSGPVPFLDDSRPKEKLLVLQRHAVDLSQAAYFYNNVLENDAQRQRLVNVLVTSLVPVKEPVQSRSFKLLHLIDKDLGNRVEIGVKAAALAASTG